MDADANQPFTIVDGIEFSGPEMMPGDMVLDALLIVRVQSPGAPKSKVTVYRSAGLDDVVETGMLQIEAARDMSLWVRAREAVDGE